MHQQSRIERGVQQSTALFVCLLFCQPGIALHTAHYRSYNLTDRLNIVAARDRHIVIVAQSKNDRLECRRNKQKYQPWCKSCCSKPRHHRPGRKPRN